MDGTHFSSRSLRLNSTPAGLTELLALTPSELAACDIALANLLCAKALAGSETLSVKTCLDTLDNWTERVRFETDRHFYRFRRNPAEFENSEPFFRMLLMVTVVQRVMGVRYNPAGIGDMSADFFADSRDVFIHGLLSSPRSGTCASMPVLYVAIGRRLNYPLYLAHAKRHLYVRWESPQAHLNIEGSGLGMASPPDEHYRTGVFTLTPTDIASGVYLRPLRPAETGAEFLMNRGCCLQRTRGLPAAMPCFRAAARLWDHHRGLVDSMEAIRAAEDLTPLRDVRLVPEIPE